MQFRWEHLAAVALAIVILLLAWFVGPILHLAGANLLILRAGIILLGVVAVIGLLLWARSHQPPLPAVEERPGVPAVPSIPSAVKILGTSSSGAASQDIDVLIREANAKVAAARLGAGAKLSALPAVFLLGETAAGKTSVMDQSGLDAELLAGQVFQENSIVPTRAANLWFARKTVFVEAGGPLMDDPASWARLIKHFLPGGLASLFGGSKAPRAAVVCVDAEKLLREAALEKIVAQARKLRARLEELSYHLGISLPVYVIFSRSDRIPYFDDFAGTFTTEEVSQVLGSTLPLIASAGSGVYAEQETRRLTAAFQGIFFSLAECRPGLLSRERVPTRQAGIYEFPREFGKLSKPLVQFLVDLCRPGHLRTGPFLRGFYFAGQRTVAVSAGGQTMLGARAAAPKAGGFSPDATSLINSQDVGAKASFGASTSLDSPSESRKSIQRIFLSHVFSQVILQDRAALGASGSSVRGDLGRRILFAGIAVLALVWIIFTVVSFAGNSGLVSSIRSAANDLAVIENQSTVVIAGVGPGSSVPQQPPSLDSLRKLDNVRQILVRLRDYDKNGVPLHLRWGLYTNSDDSLLNDARTIYFHAFDRFLFHQARAHLLADLQTYRGVPQPNADPGAPYDSLKAYLLTTSESQRNNGEFLPDFLMKDWKRDLGEVDQDHTDLAAQQFAFYSSELTLDNPFSKNDDTLLVDQVRVYLNGFSGLQRLYNSMLTNARQKAKAYRFSVAHPEGSEVLHARNEVDAAFTFDGWKVMDQSIQNPKAVQGETWVLGSAASTNLSPADLSTQLRAMYDKDFVQAWRTFLAGSSVLGYGSDADAANKLKKLSANSSPLLALLCDTSDNTNVSDPAIKQAFLAPQQVVSPGCSAQRKYDQSSNDSYMKGLLDLQSCVQDVASTPPEQKDPKKTQCLQTALQAQRNAGQVEQALPNDADGHVDQMISTLLEEPIKSLQRLWAHSPGEGSGGLCGPLKALQSAYPFNAHSTRDITLAEFNAFFQPGKGLLSQFITGQKSNLSPQGTTFVRALGSTTPIGPTFLRTLNELYAIQLAVYPNTATDPHFEYSVTAHLPDVGSFTSEKLAFDGQEWTVSSSGGTHKFVWPGPVAQGATLTMNGNLDVAHYDGIWAVSHFFSGYHWQAGSSGYVIQGPLIGPTGQPMTSNGKPVEVRFDVDFKAVPLFQAGFLSGYACAAMNK
jgi:type VI secretion system protein ImpL